MGKLKKAEEVTWMLPDLVVAFLVVVLLIAAIYAAETEDLINAVISLALLSLIVSIFFYILQAPDVAMTEAAIGAGLSTAIFIFAIKKTRRYENHEREE